MSYIVFVFHELPKLSIRERLMSGDYKVTYLSIKNDYETGCLTDTMSNDRDLNTQLQNLDKDIEESNDTPHDSRRLYFLNDRVSSGGKYYKLKISETGGKAVTDTSAWDEYQKPNIETRFAPIAQYYANLQSIKERLQNLLDESSKEISNGQGVLMNEERYSNSINPERAIKAREATNGFIPELKTQTIPILISIAAAMLAFSIVLSFQMLGVYGQITVSPAYSQTYATIQATVASITNNTTIVGGFAIISLLIASYFAYLFYTSQPRD